MKIYREYKYIYIVTFSLSIWPAQASWLIYDTVLKKCKVLKNNGFNYIGGFLPSIYMTAFDVHTVGRV